MKTLFGTLTGGLALAHVGRLHAFSPKAAFNGITDKLGASGTGKASAKDAPGHGDQETDTKAYAAFLTALGLRHLRTADIMAPHFKVRGKVHNGIPPRELWNNMVPTLRVADKLQPLLAVPLVSVISAYRTPAYNAACSGSASQSCHMQNLALDLQFACSPSKVAKAAETLRAQGHFKGGIGRYPGFIHVDTRGHNADWG